MFYHEKSCQFQDSHVLKMYQFFIFCGIALEFTNQLLKGAGKIALAMPLYMTGRHTGSI